eukprot:4009271-Amphidinium_carterae.1
MANMYTHKHATNHALDSQMLRITEKDTIAKGFQSNAQNQHALSRCINNIQIISQSSHEINDEPIYTNIAKH